MYCHAHPGGKSLLRALNSEDGIHWELPSLELVEFEGLRDNSNPARKPSPKGSLSLPIFYVHLEFFNGDGLTGGGRTSKDPHTDQVFSHCEQLGPRLEGQPAAIDHRLAQ